MYFVLEVKISLKFRASDFVEVVKVYMQTMGANESEGSEFWVQYWEPLIYGVMSMGTYEEDRTGTSDEEDASLPMEYLANREIGGDAESGAEAGYETV